MPHSSFLSRRGQPWQSGNWLVGIVTARWPVWPCLGTACGSTEQLCHSQQQPLASGQCQDLELLRSTRLFVLHFDTSFWGTALLLLLIYVWVSSYVSYVLCLITLNCPSVWFVCVSCNGLMDWPVPDVPTIASVSTVTLTRDKVVKKKTCTGTKMFYYHGFSF